MSEPPAYPPPEPEQPYGQVPYPASSYQPYPPQPGHGPVVIPQAHGGATTGMVLGIVSIAIAVVGLSCYGLISWVAVITGPIGIVKSRRAIREIDADPGRYTNRGNATAGQVCSIVGTVLGALAIVFFVVIIIAVIATET